MKKVKRPMPLVLFCEPYKGLNETPAKVLEQCIDLLGNPREYFALHGTHISTLVFSSCEMKLGSVVLHYIINKPGDLFIIIFLFERHTGLKLAK